MRLSIVTVCFNAEKTIKKCIESVYSLNISIFEYIIIDGKSSDNTLKIIQSFQSKFVEKRVNFVIISEEDTGIYNAMNKAIDIANGDWVIFLNADDYFYCENSINCFLENDYQAYDVVYGDVAVRNLKTITYQKTRNLQLLKSGTEMPFCHQSTFTKLDALKKYRYNEKYSIIADIDLYLRIFEDGGRFYYLPECISVFSNDGLSQTHRIESIREGKQLLKSHNCYTFNRKLVLNGYIIWYKIKDIIPKCIKCFIKLKWKSLRGCLSYGKKEESIRYY